MREPRWGLCCQFLDSPIRFRQTTHRYCSGLTREQSRAHISGIVLANARTLQDAITRCADLGIGAFRITSQLVPLATHPESGYALADLPQGDEIIAAFRSAREAARRRDVRLSFHPDQFIVLNSESNRVVTASVREMEHHAAIAELTGAEALTLHGGGRAGGVAASLQRLERGIERLSTVARGLLALENDDRLFAPGDLLPFCERTGIPFIYDAHHHRCHFDGMPVNETSERAMATWKRREPWMHISSPKGGWASSNPRAHADYIDPSDVPAGWIGKRVTVDVEAKAKERAVIAIAEAIREQRDR